MKTFDESLKEIIKGMFEDGVMCGRMGSKGYNKESAFARRRMDIKLLLKEAVPKEKKIETWENIGFNQAIAELKKNLGLEDELKEVKYEKKN